MNPATALALAAALLSSSLAVGAADAELAQILAGKHRTPQNVARDRYRHPQETLEFFGLKSGMSVVEVWPGSGWWTEILAPYLRDQGQYTAAATSPRF